VSAATHVGVDATVCSAVGDNLDSIDIHQAHRHVVAQAHKRPVDARQLGKRESRGLRHIFSLEAGAERVVLDAGA